MSPRDFAAHIKARTPAEMTPLPVSSVKEIAPEIRIAEVVARVRTLPMPTNGEMATLAVASFQKLLPAEGEAMSVNNLLSLVGVLRQLATCHRVAGDYEAEKACAAARADASTVYNIVK